MCNLKYLDDESHDGMEVRVFPSLEELSLLYLPDIEELLKVERGEMFPCLSKLTIKHCPKLGLPCLPSLKVLDVMGCNNELLRSISNFCGLTYLILCGRRAGITSFPEGMFTNLTFLKTLYISEFPKLKELPNEPINPALEFLRISWCNELESLPEKIWESLQTLRFLSISECKGLRCLPEGIRHLTSLEVLDIYECPTLKERCKEGTGDDWDKIAHIPKVDI
jgi:leucine-rich repeat protein SHOC2